ncbi:hypothetical protein [Mucilaginibacter sp.]|uniref:hypothetical protein n=1 Tax=Mucilaginibacter sp. TaxID=1882438 RepID=UPI002606AC71|nr:hypothetical protein [Mucilaginibacter sp.]MDB4926296.1 hypothetical protein [Mucilaginibacter sp.]
MNAAFTIVAKNYFSVALTLADSIKKNHPGIDFYILLADETNDKIDFEGENHLLVFTRDINIPLYNNLAFKYNITEFCTAVKPFFFDYLFKLKNYEKIIYFDPDIYVYSSLNSIYNALNNSTALITPHFITPQINYTGNAPETAILFAGIYNLGFIALKNCDEGLLIIEWWKERLYDLCYADKFEALHVDQKWVDFLPALYKGVAVSRYLGYNIAYWNIHERQFVKTGNESYKVINRITMDEGDPLVFVHFSGLNPLDIYNNKQCPTIIMSNYPDWEVLIKEYAQRVIENDFSRYLSYSYAYAEFENGDKITQFHRRLFRRITDENIKSFDDPFAVGENSFFELIRKNKLLIKKSSNADKLNERNFEGFDNKIKKLNAIMRYIKRILGFEKYTLLLKFCQRYFRPENQTFLIKELANQIKFKNENINT